MKGEAQFRKYHNLIVSKNVSVGVMATPKKVASPFRDGVDAESSAQRRTIQLIYSTKNRTMDLAVPVMAHEYGHIVVYDKHGQVRLTRTEKLLLSLNGWDFTRVKLSNNSKKAIYRDEVRAWDEGEKFLRRYGYKTWNIFEEVKGAALATYREAMWNLK